MDEHISVEQLLAAVEQRKELYDSRHPSYKDVDARAVIWREIAWELKASANACRKKWKYLRGQFLKNYKLLVGIKDFKDGPAPVNVKPWRYHNRMLFILPHIDVKESHAGGSLEDREGDDEDENGEGNRDSEHYDPHEYKPVLPLEMSPLVEINVDNSSGGQALDNGPSRPRLFNRKSLSAENGDDYVLEDSAVARRRRRVKVKGESSPREVLSEDDCVDIFFKSMAKATRMLSPYLQAQVKRRVCDVVTEAEMTQHLMGQSGEGYPNFHRPPPPQNSGVPAGTSCHPLAQFGFPPYHPLQAVAPSSSKRVGSPVSNSTVSSQEPS